MTHESSMLKLKCSEVILTQGQQEGTKLLFDIIIIPSVICCLILRLGGRTNQMWSLRPIIELRHRLTFSTLVISALLWRCFIAQRLTKGGLASTPLAASVYSEMMPDLFFHSHVLLNKNCVTSVCYLGLNPCCTLPPVRTSTLIVRTLWASMFLEELKMVSYQKLIVKITRWNFQLTFMSSFHLRE